MRVLLVAPYFPPEVTGSSNFVNDLAHGLTDAGHEVLVLTASGSAQSDQFTVVSLPARRVAPGRIAFGYSIPVVSGPRNWRTISSIFDDFRPDVVASQGQIFDITLTVDWIAKRRGIPTVMTVHSAIWHDNKVLNAVLAAGDRILSGLLLRRTTSAWIGVDDRTVQHIRLRYSPDPVTIPICVRRGLFSSGDAEAARRKYSFDGSPVIASIGHVVPVRDRLALVRALPAIVAQHPGLNVLVVGRVADESFITLASELGVMDHIKVLGPTPHADIADILAASDIEIHDLQGFGLGIASLEPIDAGVPIVAFARDNNIPGVSLRAYSPGSFLEDNRAESVAGCVLRILGDDGFRSTIVAQQRRLLEDVYYLDVVTAKYVAEFERLVNA